MSNIALFALGTGVTSIVVAALALLVWGAVLDGRDERASRAARRVPTPVPETPFALPRAAGITARVVPLPPKKGEAA
jgi:hypothetical protein